MLGGKGRVVRNYPTNHRSPSCINKLLCVYGQILYFTCAYEHCKKCQWYGFTQTMCGYHTSSFHMWLVDITLSHFVLISHNLVCVFNIWCAWHTLLSVEITIMIHNDDIILHNHEKTVQGAAVCEGWSWSSFSPCTQPSSAEVTM